MVQKNTQANSRAKNFDVALSPPSCFQEETNDNLNMNSNRLYSKVQDRIICALRSCSKWSPIVRMLLCLLTFGMVRKRNCRRSKRHGWVRLRCSLWSPMMLAWQICVDDKKAMLLTPSISLYFHCWSFTPNHEVAHGSNQLTTSHDLKYVCINLLIGLLSWLLP